MGKIGCDMARWQIVLISILTVCGLGGIMTLTNPERADYEDYAVEQLGHLAISQCDRVPAFGTVLQEPCRAALAAIKPQIRPMLAAATTRQNFIIFSIYRSNISIPAANFHAKVESIGLFSHFYTYKTP
jgi:Domain of unknown function (DUF4359)